MSLWAELKRRNVFRVALFYIVSAWVVVQVAETVLPMFDVPEVALRAIVVILALGFPLVMVFSWAFELTPDGLKLDRNAHADPAGDQHTSRKLNWATLIAAVLAIGLLVADRLMPEPSVATAEPALANLDSPADRVSAEADDAVDPASIAVLPFEDLSPNGDQGYFSDGIAEEILNVLVRIDGLEVASRTSAFRFRDRDDIGIPGIARELEVRHVLEGSVRKAGDAIRVTAQLIDGQSDKHLWSDTYDRSLTAENVFAIQDEIATAIVEALRGSIALPGAEALEVGARTDSLDAYELYLEARALYNARNRMDRADEQLARAVEIDPEFAAAWAIRAAIYMLDDEYGHLGIARDVSVARYEEYAATALANDPDNALAIAVLAFGRLTEARFGRARHSISQIIDDLERVIALDPKNASARNWLGVAYGEVGELEAALAQFQTCNEDDPYYAPCAENVYDTLTSLGRMDEALAAYLRALEAGATTDGWVNLSLLVHFDLKAHFMSVTNQSLYLPGWRRHGELWAAWRNLGGNHEALAREIRAYADEHLDLADNSSHVVNLLVPLGGSFDLNPFSILIWDEAYVNYRQSPEFRKRVRDLDIHAYWRENGFPPQCQSVREDDFGCE